MEGSFGVIFFLFFLLVAGIGYYVWKREQERIAGIAAYAAQVGAEYYPHAADLSGGWFSGPSGIGRVVEKVRAFGAKGPFEKGHSRRASHALLFPDEKRLRLTTFDYQYKITTSNGKSTQTTTYPFRVLIAEVPMQLPPLELEPEHLGHRIAEKFGMREIEFELEEFNRKYFVRCSDREGAFALLDQQMMEHLLRAYPFQVVCNGPYFLMAESGMQTAADIDRMAGAARAFVRHIPEYLWRDRAIPGRFE
jgi:hypothetical protein